MLAEEEEMLQDTMIETIKNTTELYANYPCISFRAKLQQDIYMGLTEIQLNDKYLREVGYSMDDLAVTILREGIPQFIPLENTFEAKSLMENYHIVGKHGHQTPELESAILLKNGYTRKIKYKVYYFKTFENGIIGLDGMIVILEKDPPLCPEPDQKVSHQLNTEFLRKVISKEKKSSKFLEKYYDTSINLKYTNMEKVCKIRELEAIQTE